MEPLNNFPFKGVPTVARHIWGSHCIVPLSIAHARAVPCSLAVGQLVISLWVGPQPTQLPTNSAIFANGFH